MVAEPAQCTSKRSSIFACKPIVPVVYLRGVIASPKGPGGGKTLSLQSVEKTLTTAFKTRNAKAVAIVINSPGGAPATTSIIYNYIRQLSEKYKLEVYTFVEDVAASGGYWLALAGTKVYATPSSIVGSVGVITAGFGFHEAMQRHGVERRLVTQGKNKSLFDAFLPIKESDVERIKRLQAGIIVEFRRVVLERRGSKLTLPPHEHWQPEDKGRLPSPSDPKFEVVRQSLIEEMLLSGDVFCGTDALQVGMVDGLGDMHTILARDFGPDVKLVQPKMGLGDVLGMLAMGAGVKSMLSSPKSKAGASSSQSAIDVHSVVDSVVQSLEAQSAWNSFAMQ